MRTVVALLCVGGGLTGCASVDEPGPSEPAWQSSTRMRAKKLVTADGFEAITGWYDSELALDCLEKRQTPYEVCGAVDVLAHYYTDATCSEPAISLNTPGRFAWGREFVHEQLIAYEVGAPWTGPTYALFDSCVPVQPYPTMYRASVTTSLAIAHYEPGTAEASRHVWSDGAYQLMPAVQPAKQSRLRGHIGAMFDQLRGEPCVPLEVAGQLRCLPFSAPGPVLYSDAECTTTVDRTVNTSPVLVGDHLVYPTNEMSLDQYWWKTIAVPGGTPTWCEKFPWERGTYGGLRVELDEFAELFPVVE